MREKPFQGGRDAGVAANMEVALERACKLLEVAEDTHHNRSFIARKIIDAVEMGQTTLSDLTDVGTKAVGMLHAIKSPGQGGGTLA